MRRTHSARMFSLRRGILLFLTIGMAAALLTVGAVMVFTMRAYHQSVDQMDMSALESANSLLYRNIEHLRSAVTAIYSTNDLFEYGLSIQTEADRLNRISTYVWLPIRFDDNVPHIEWLDEWRL